MHLFRVMDVSCQTYVKIMMIMANWSIQSYFNKINLILYKCYLTFDTIPKIRTFNFQSYQAYYTDMCRSDINEQRGSQVIKLP